MLRIAQYRTWDELQELRPHWNLLLSCTTSDTVFLTWEWCEAWWKNYGVGRELLVLGAWDNQELIGVAPLYVDPLRRYGVICRVLRLIGDGSHDSDYLDCFARTAREAEVMSAFAASLHGTRELWDWVELSGPRKDSTCAAALIECAREKGWKCSTEVVPCATLELPHTWEDYLRALAPRFRTKVRSSLALLENTVKSNPVQCCSKSEIEGWLPLLFDLHTRRWASEGKPGVFRTGVKRSFYFDITRSALERGWLALHRLNWAERPLALQYGLVYRNRFHLLQEAYDPDFSAIRPGLALRAWLLRHWIESGLREYDFLAGTATHKLEWGAKRVETIRLVISPKSARTTIALDMPNLRSQIKGHLANAAPQLVLSAHKKLRTKMGAKSVFPEDQAQRRPREMASIARRVVSLAYSSWPLAIAGRAVATEYTWNRFRNRWSIPLHRRERPVLHIFQYHRVNDDGDPFLSGLPAESFRAQVQYLTKNFPIVTLDEVANEDFRPRHRYCAAITFDDGYRDNFVCAFPILKEFGIPATIFLATGYVESQQLPWYDQVRLAFKLTTRTRFSVAELSGPGGSLANLSARLRLLEQTLGWLRAMDGAQRDSALKQIYRALGVPSDLNLPNQMLRWEDIRQMSKQKISFGAHTVTHPVLSRIPASELKAEIEGSKRTIEDRLQLPVSHFAYPFGQTHDFNAQAKAAVQDAGFKTAVTTIWGLNEFDDDPLELKRFTPWETDLAEFKMKLDWFRFREPQKAGTTKTAHTEMPPIVQGARV